MSASQTVNLIDVIDNQKIRPHNILMIVLTILLLLVDGYDIVAPGFAAPFIVRDWDIKNPAALGPLFSASIVGILLGAPILGFFADRYGRRLGLIVGALVFGTFSLSSCLATDINQLIILRFLAGLGLGGVMPISLALNAEYAPKRFRARILCIILLGLTIGTGSPGPVAAWLAPSYGWKVIFLVGGVLPILLAAVLYFWLPESPTFLAANRPDSKELRVTLMKMQPGVQIDAATRIDINDDKQKTDVGIRSLFLGRFALLTPLVWLIFFVLILVQYSIQAWTPTVLIAAGIPMTRAVLGTTVFQIGASVGALLMGWSIDRMGILPVTVCMLLGVPVVACVGMAGLPEQAIMGMLFLAGLLVIGCQIGMDALASIIYPSFMKAKGVGFALGFGRLGAIVGAMAGGYLVAMHLSMQTLFLILAVPLLFSFAACIALGRKINKDQAEGGAAEALNSVVISRAPT